MSVQKEIIRPVKEDWCSICGKMVVLERVRGKYKIGYDYDEDGNSWETDEMIEYIFFVCNICKQYIHVYPCVNWNTERSCAECRGIADQRRYEREDE